MCRETRPSPKTQGPDVPPVPLMVLRLQDLKPRSHPALLPFPYPKEMAPAFTESEEVHGDGCAYSTPRAKEESKYRSRQLIQKGSLKKRRPHWGSTDS